MNVFLTNLKRQAEENPMVAIAAGVAVVTVATQLVGMGVSARNSHAWAKEVARRSMKDAVLR
jgi:hypothetical protein